MSTVAIVQARMSSRRFPGKILVPFGGATLLGTIIENLRHCRMLDQTCIATSTDTTDDAVEVFAKQHGMHLHRGPLDDVALRMLQAAEAMGAEVFARINGDSPLLDPALVDRGIRLFHEGGADLVTNVLPRSFPKGQSVEVVSCAAMKNAVRTMTDAHEREHVTTHFYARPQQYRIKSFTAEIPRPDLQLSVDEPADLVRCHAILGHLGVPPWQAGWQACVRAADALAGRASQSVD